MASVKIKINCPSCNSNECECYSNYKAGTEWIFCPICEFTRKYFHKRDDVGNFAWQSNSKHLPNENIIMERKAPVEPYAVYIIEKSSLNGDTIGGELYEKEDCDNFKTYIDFILARKPELKKVTVRIFIDGRSADTILYPKNIIG